MKLIAFHNDAAVKAKYLKRVQEHRAADELVKMATVGRMDDGSFQGCAVVCTLEKYEHAAYEVELGVPRMLARLEDGIFENLPDALAMTWPERFLEAIPVGADLSKVGDQFLHWLLVDPVDGVVRLAKTKKTREVVEGVGALYAQKIAGAKIGLDEWRNARAAAYAAYASAYAAAPADARSGARVRQSEKLLELMAAAPIAEVVG